LQHLDTHKANIEASEAQYERSMRDMSQKIKETEATSLQNGRKRQRGKSPSLVIIACLCLFLFLFFFFCFCFLVLLFLLSSYGWRYFPITLVSFPLLHCYAVCLLGGSGKWELGNGKGMGRRVINSYIPMSAYVIRPVLLLPYVPDQKNNIITWAFCGEIVKEELACLDACVHAGTSR
jgi:hypothetical protein